MANSSKCPVCANASDNLCVEYRKNVPTLQNITLETPEKALNFPSGEIDMLRCAACSFVWNDAFDFAAISYDDNYNNDVSSSNFYQEHLNAMADNVLNAVPLGEPIHYVEIGCGNADFMKLVLERSNGRCVSATGFDPSYSEEEDLPDQMVVHKTMFGFEQLDLVSPATNIICSRHTIEHVPDPKSFISAIAKAANRNGIKLLLETPNVDWILRNAAFQDFFYEHCSIYTPASVRHLLGAYGLKCEIKDVYNGQYMWIEANQSGGSSDGPETVDNLVLARSYIEKRKFEFQKWQDFLRARQQVGKVAIWGAASKGVTFNLLFSNGSEILIDCAIDLNPAKQGRFLPATGLPVTTPQAAMDLGVATVIIMNPNYAKEIAQMAADMRWHPEFSVLNDHSG